MSAAPLRLLFVLAALVPALSACDALVFSDADDEPRRARKPVEDRLAPAAAEAPTVQTPASAAPGDETTPAAPIPYDQLRAPAGSGGEPELKSDDVFY